MGLRLKTRKSGYAESMRMSLTKAWDELECFRSFLSELGALEWPSEHEPNSRTLLHTLADGGQQRSLLRVA